jgi:hypothetical protein
MYQWNLFDSFVHRSQKRGGASSPCALEPGDDAGRGGRWWAARNPTSIKRAGQPRGGANCPGPRGAGGP